MKNFLLTELSTPGTGRPFDGMAVGSFVGMSGNRATFLPDEMPVYVQNTRALIESTRTASGELVGLPIDAYGHDHGTRAAGWIVDVQLSADGQKIEFFPNWTAEGIELIESNARRFFSPTIDLVGKVCMGGSLTNWPATRTATEIKLRPVELSAGAQVDLIDGSLNEQIDRVCTAFINQFMDQSTGYPWPVEVYTDSLVVITDSEKLYRLGYTLTADAVEFEPVESWVQVRLSYIEAALQVVNRAIRAAVGAFSKSNQAAAQPPANQKGVSMTDTQPPLDLQALLAGNPESTAELNALIDRQVETRVQATLEAQRRAVELQAYARRVVQGDAEHPHAIAGITESELAEFMTSLAPDQVTRFQNMLDRIQKTAPVEFSELGHGKTLPGTKPLPDWAAVELTKAVAGGMTIPEFFAVNAVELGEMADYDLAKFGKKE